MSSRRTVLLNTGHKIPTLGYGTWLCSEETVSEAVFEALKVGYRHLDLAKVYGNQIGVGDGIKRALAEIPGLKREDIFVTSKLWNNSHRPEDVEPTLDDTLAELGLDYLDVSIFKKKIFDQSIRIILCFAHFMQFYLIHHDFRSYILFIGQLLSPPARFSSQKIQRPAQSFLTKECRFVRHGKVYSFNFM